MFPLDSGLDLRSLAQRKKGWDRVESFGPRVWGWVIVAYGPLCLPQRIARAHQSIFFGLICDEITNNLLCLFAEQSKLDNICPMTPQVEVAKDESHLTRKDWKSTDRGHHLNSISIDFWVGVFKCEVLVTKLRK